MYILDEPSIGLHPRDTERLIAVLRRLRDIGNSVIVVEHDEETIRADFARISDYLLYLKDLFPELPDFKELSIGMSGDYRIALEYGATIVRIGTAIFGDRAV